MVTLGVKIKRESRGTGWDGHGKLSVISCNLISCNAIFGLQLV